MSVQQTSIDAYYKDVLPTLADRHHAVMEAMLQKENFSNSELAHFLGWPINTVTPRVYELRKRGLIVEDTTRPCKITGRTVKAWTFKLFDV